MNSMNINAHRHEKEHMYGMITLVVGGLVWLTVLLTTVGMMLILLIPIGIMFLGLSQITSPYFL